MALAHLRRTGMSLAGCLALLAALRVVPTGARPGAIAALPGPEIAAVVAALAPADSLTAAAGDSLAIYVKSPAAAGLKSAVLPGWGQWYNGNKAKGIIMAALQAAFIAGAVWQNQRVVSAVSENQRDLYKSQRSRFVWLAAAERGYSILDAYVDAHFVGFDQDIGVELPDEE